MYKFKAVKGNEAGKNWLICSTGQDDENNHCYVTTDGVHASELHECSRGAEGDAELIAELLVWYYRDPSRADYIMEIHSLYTPKV